MKRRNISALLSVMVVATFLGGCGNAQTADTVTETQTMADTQTKTASGVVALKVWSDETQFAMLEKMIETFKKEYAGQAEFNITLENVSESGTRDAILGDIVNYYSANKEWAHKLAEWLANEENQVLRFEEMNVGLSNINAAASDAVSKVPATAAVIAQSEYGVVQRVGNNYWAPCGDLINSLSTEDIHGDDLQKLLDNIVNRITSQ